MAQSVLHRQNRWRAWCLVVRPLWRCRSPRFALLRACSSRVSCSGAAAARSNFVVVVPVHFRARQKAVAIGV